MSEEEARKQRTRRIVLAYPLILLVIAVLLNLSVFGVDPIAPALPSRDCIVALAIAALLLVYNHTWLMTSTELTRVKHTMFSTPEDRAASGAAEIEIPEQGINDLDRRHKAHRNTTENTVIFCLLAPMFALISPTVLATYIWIVAFGVARVGYTWSYLAGRTQSRGLFMSLGLLSIYGIMSYVVISLIV